MRVSQKDPARADRLGAPREGAARRQGGSGAGTAEGKEGTPSRASSECLVEELLNASLTFPQEGTGKMFRTLHGGITR